MGNQGSMDSEDGPGFADANADNIIRGPYMSLCSFCRAPTQSKKISNDQELIQSDPISCP